MSYADNNLRRSNVLGRPGLPLDPPPGYRDALLAAVMLQAENAGKCFPLTEGPPKDPSQQLPTSPPPNEVIIRGRYGVIIQ
jgi:hypothetical protein